MRSPWSMKSLKQPLPGAGGIGRPALRPPQAGGNAGGELGRVHSHSSPGWSPASLSNLRLPRSVQSHSTFCLFNAVQQPWDNGDVAGENGASSGLASQLSCAKGITAQGYFQHDRSQVGHDVQHQRVRTQLQVAFGALRCLHVNYTLAKSGLIWSSQGCAGCWDPGQCRKCSSAQKK